MVAAALLQPARADIYLYIDSQGVLHFTNTPTSSDYRLYIKEKPRPDDRHLALVRPLVGLIREAAARHGLPPALVKAMIRVESHFDPRAVSKKGAKGLMQLMPEVAAAYGLTDPFDPRQNVLAGTAYLKTLLDRYQGRLPLALAAYNAGPSAVDRYQGIPPFAETERFVQKVMRFYYLYRKTSS